MLETGRVVIPRYETQETNIRSEGAHTHGTRSMAPIGDLDGSRPSTIGTTFIAVILVTSLTRCRSKRNCHHGDKQKPLR
jgi:hypothetical protein